MKFICQQKLGGLIFGTQDKYLKEDKSISLNQDCKTMLICLLEMEEFFFYLKKMNFQELKKF
jgi:hypothetical protein